MTSDQSQAVTRCLIVDDQAMVRDGFGALLDAQPGLTVVGLAANGAEAVRLAGELKPDVVLMDVRMPVMDGLAATAEILGGDSPEERPRVLILTTFDLDDYVYEALRAGASGFLLKDAPGGEPVTRSEWSRRATHCSPRRSRAADRGSPAVASVTRAPHRAHELTPRELRSCD